MDKQNFDDQRLTQQLCRICGKRPATSREHLPPQAASNRGPVEINYIDGTTPSGDMQYHIIRSSNGFWVPNLCEVCNNKKTGSRYGGAYGDFVSQIANASGIEDTSNRILVHFRGIYPLRVLKQMFSMFLAAVPYEPAPVWKEIQDFVLKRDTALPSNAPFVYLYKNISRVGRIVPCCGIVELATHKTMVMSEVSWPPVGIVFSFQQDERFGIMENITNWGQYKFKDRKDFLIKLPKLRVNSHYPLSFGTLQEIEQEQERRLPLYLFHVPENSQSLTDISALWKYQE